MSDEATRTPSLSRWRARLIPPLVLLAVTLVLSIGQLSRPAIPRGDDIIFHAQCVTDFTTALRDGTLYPRWAATVNRGYGAPVFVFYPPLGHYLLAVPALLTGDVFAALRAVPVAVLFLSGLSFWLAIRNTTTPLAAVVASAAYILLPYHALDLFWRFAWAEFVAFLWLPPLFLSVRSLMSRFTWTAWFALTLAAAGLLFTHVATATLLPLVLGPYALAHLLHTRRWSALPAIATAAAAAIVLAAVYLLPVIVRQHEVHLDWTLGDWFDWERNFVFRDETAFGYEADETKPVVTRAVTSQLVLAVAAGALLIWRPVPNRFEGWLCLGLTAWSVVLQTALATPLWRTLPLLETVQFPWRFGIYQVLMTCLLVAAALDGRTGPGSRPLARALVVALAALPSLAVSYEILPDKTSFDREFMLSEDYRAEAVREYIPIAVPSWEWLRRPRAARTLTLDRGAFEIISWRSHQRRFRVSSPAGSRVKLHTFAFAGWTAELDGDEVPLLDGLTIAFDVPAGDHDILVAFRPTWDRTAGAALSTAAALALLLLAWRTTRAHHG